MSDDREQSSLGVCPTRWPFRSHKFEAVYDYRWPAGMSVEHRDYRGPLPPIEALGERHYRGHVCRYCGLQAKRS